MTGRKSFLRAWTKRRSDKKARWEHVFLDSNVFIYHFQGHQQFSRATSKIFTRVFAGDWQAHTSVISLLETLSLPAPPQIIEELYQSCLQIPRLEIRAIDLGISVEAARLRREHGLRTPDALQLATALLTDSQVFLTNDRRLQHFPEIPVLLLEDIPA